MTADQLSLLGDLPSPPEVLAVTADTPGRVRHDGPATSKAAAQKAAPRTGSHRARILLHLASLGEHGATDEELWEATGGRFPHVAATRRGELAAAGLVEATDKTRPTAAGNPAVVHAITGAGAVVAASLTVEAP